MCQLTLGHIISGETQYLKLVMGILMRINGLKMKDGWGIYSDILTKSAKPVLEDDDFINVINKINTKTVIGHIRFSTTAKDIIDAKNSHPFDKKNIVLAHNGTLIGENMPLDITDSEYFADCLDKELDTEDNFVNAIKNTYSDFFGKFAFLIYNKKDNKYYIIRGFNAPLHKVTITITNKRCETNLLIVNTQDDSIRLLLDALKFVLPVQNLKVEHTIVERLQPESIFVLENHELVYKEKMEEYLPPKLVQPEVKAYAPVNNGVNKDNENIDTIFNFGKSLAVLEPIEVLALCYNLNKESPTEMLYSKEIEDMILPTIISNKVAKKKRKYIQDIYDYYKKIHPEATVFDFYVAEEVFKNFSVGKIKKLQSKIISEYYKTMKE